MFTIGGAFLCSDAAGRGSSERYVMTTEGFAFLRDIKICPFLLQGRWAANLPSSL